MLRDLPNNKGVATLLEPGTLVLIGQWSLLFRAVLVGGSPIPARALLKVEIHELAGLGTLDLHDRGRPGTPRPHDPRLVYTDDSVRELLLHDRIDTVKANLDQLELRMLGTKVCLSALQERCLLPLETERVQTAIGL